METPTPSSSTSPSLQTAPFMNAISSSALASATTTNGSTAHRYADNDPSGKTPTPYDQTIIHNGFDIEDPDPKASLSTHGCMLSISHASRILRGCVRRNILIMPLPAEWPRATGLNALLLERAVVVAHDCYGAHETMRAQGDSLKRYPCPCCVAL